VVIRPVAHNFYWIGTTRCKSMRQQDIRVSVCADTSSRNRTCFVVVHGMCCDVKKVGRCSCTPIASDNSIFTGWQQCICAGHAFVARPAFLRGSEIECDTVSPNRPSLCELTVDQPCVRLFTLSIFCSNKYCMKLCAGSALRLPFKSQQDDNSHCSRGAFQHQPSCICRVHTGSRLHYLK